MSFKPYEPYLQIESHILFDDTLSAIVREDHPLAKYKRISVHLLADYDLVLPTKGLQARNTLDAMVGKRNLELHIMMTVWDGDHNHSYTNNERISAGGLNFAQNSSLSTLSWRIADRHLSLPVANRMLDYLTSQKRLNKWLVLILVGFANASFCRLFNGKSV